MSNTMKMKMKMMRNKNDCVLGKVYATPAFNFFCLSKFPLEWHAILATAFILAKIKINKKIVLN